ncbi:MAG: hypothetical protein GC199_01360 [Alphaproteobacteria bacterium]|nr:hypothetical protein [Alphaproteobacteria bacterium]
MSEAERALWREAMKDVAPVAGDAAPRHTPPVANRKKQTMPPKAASATPAKPHRPPPAPIVHEAPGFIPGLDGRTARRLARGDVAVDATLDLHGMRQEEAHGALIRFIGAMSAAGLRCGLVVTGKGRASGASEGTPGILRAMVPQWLRQNPIAERIIAIVPKRDSTLGPPGAYYVYLRRRR